MFVSSDESEPERDAHELLARATEDLEEDLEKLGVYVEIKHVTTRDVPGGVQAVLVIGAVIGRVAFSVRVQRPEQEAFDEAFSTMTDQMIEDEFEERRRRALDD